MPRTGRGMQPPAQTQFYETARRLVEQYIRNHNIEGSPVAETLRSRIPSGIYWKAPTMGDIETLANSLQHLNRNWRPSVPQMVQQYEQGIRAPQGPAIQRNAPNIPRAQQPQLVNAPNRPSLRELMNQGYIDPDQVAILEDIQRRRGQPAPQAQPQPAQAQLVSPNQIVGPFNQANPNAAPQQQPVAAQATATQMQPAQFPQVQRPETYQPIPNPELNSAIEAQRRELAKYQPPPLTRQQAIDELVRDHPYRRGETNPEYARRLSQIASDLNNPNNPFARVPGDQRGPISLQDLALEQATPSTGKRGKQEVSTPSPEPARGGGRGGGGAPGPLVNPPVAALDPRQAFLVDRMSALLGQIRRAGRRATPNEMEQVREIYNQLPQNLPQQVIPQLDRIRRDFNQQAALLHINGIGAVGELMGQTAAGRLGVPVDRQGDVNMDLYEQQFPRFFNDLHGLKPEAQVARENRNDNNAMNLYRKIRSDINQVRWERNQGEVGYDPIPRQGEDRAAQMARHKREDAQYRASDAYRNTVLPQGVVSESVPLRPEQLAGQTGNVGIALGQAPSTFSVQTGQTAPRVQGNATGAQPAANAPGNVPAIQPGAQQIGPNPTARDVFLGGPTTLTNIPMYTPEQIGMINEARTMAQNSLQQAGQPINYFPVQQQQAANSLNSILNRLQNGDMVGAQQELTLAGGPANITQLANVPGLAQLQPPANLTVPQQQQFSQQLFGPRLQGGAAQQPQAQAQPQAPAQPVLNTRQIDAAINEMNRIDDRAHQRSGLDPIRYTQSEATRFSELYNQVLNSNPPARIQQELGNLGRLYTTATGGLQLPAQPAPAPQQPAAQSFVAAQPGPLGFIAPGLAAPQPAQQPGLAGLLNVPGQVQQAYQQGGGGLGGFLGALQAGARGLSQAANIGQQAAQIPGQVQQAYGQGGLQGILGATQAAAQGIGNLGRRGWEFGPAYGMGYPHPLPFTAANELNRFYEQTVPTLAERFTAAGGQRSSAFPAALGAAGRGLGLGLAALGEQQQGQNAQLALQAQQQAYNQQQADYANRINEQRYMTEQQQQERAFQQQRGMQLLPTGLQQLVTPTVIPSTPGILPGMIQTAGQALKTGAMAAML